MHHRTNKNATQLQLRLYCTSVDHYSPTTGQGFGANARSGIPMDFPQACEAKVNDCIVTANLKGIKKKPGTAPPANLSATKVPSGHSRSAGSWALRLDSIAEPNRVDLNYANTEKQYFMLVYLVEATSVDQLAESISKNKVRTKEEVIRSCECLHSHAHTVWRSLDS